MFRQLPIPADFVATTVTILALLNEQADACLSRRAITPGAAKPSPRPILSPKMHVATEYDRIAVSRDNWPLPLTDTSTTKSFCRGK